MKKLLSLLINLLFLAGVFGQNIEFSPLSRYGFGELNKNRAPISLHCGGAGVAYYNTEEFNPNNPASLGFLKLTDAEIGFHAKYKEITDKADNLADDWSGNISYIHIGVPLRNTINEVLERKQYKHNYGVSLDLSPFSTTGYHYVVQDSANDIGSTTRILDSYGGLSRFSVGFGYRYKNWGFGLAAGYIFGNVKYYQSLTFNDFTGVANNFLDDQFHASGFTTDLGVIYTRNLNQKQIDKDKSIKARSLNFGLHLTSPSQLNMSKTSLYITRLNTSNSIVDTLLYEKDKSSNADLPLKLEVGVYYNHKQKYGWLCDLSYENWTSSKLFEGAKGTLTNLVGISAGGWWRPGTTGYGNILKRSQYRYGAYHESGYISINGEGLSRTAFTLGLAMPFSFQRQTAVINLGVEAGFVQAKDLFSEQYIKFNIGFRLNDNEWFLKRRYN
ncbi:MAG: hypothetical protein WAT21_06710 [Saprospiraceae bacterium]